MQGSALRAEVPERGTSARVRIEYVLESRADTVPVDLLRFGATDVEALELTAGGDGQGPVAGADAARSPTRAGARPLAAAGSPLVVPLLPASGARLSARLPLPPPDADGRRRLAVAYEVRNAVEASGGAYRVRLPIASIGLPPPSDIAGRAFSAEVRAPSGWSVTEAFPSGLAAATDGRLRVELAAVPALVSFRGRTDGRSPPGLQLVLALIGGAVLAAFCAVGWRHLRSVAG